MPALRNVGHEGIGGEARGKPRQYKRKAAARLPFQAQGKPQSKKRKSPDRHRGALCYNQKCTRTVFALSSKKWLACKPLKEYTLACDERRCSRGEQDGVGMH